MTTAWYRYVRYDDIAAFEAIGWKLVENLTPCSHDFWSTLMKWCPEGENMLEWDGEWPPQPPL